jgi:GNAT superfamily N-acetyltransferase
MTESTAKGRPAEYRVTQGDIDRDADSIQALWTKGFEWTDDQRAAARLDWMYRANPAGPGAVFLLDDAGRPVGVKCFGRRDFGRGGSKLRAGIMADFVVDRQHRSLGPALKLLKAAVEEAKGQRLFDFVYGFPNPSATSVFRRAGYRELGAMRRYAKLLRSKHFLEGRLARPWAVVLAPILDLVLALRDLVQRFGGLRYRWRRDDTFDESFDKLAGIRRSYPLMMSDRSAELLRWRFTRVGSSPWRVSTARRRATGELAGYVVWRKVDGMAQVADFCSIDDRTVTALLVFLSRLARREGCRSVFVEFSGSPSTTEAIRAAGFYPREESPVYFMDFTDAGNLFQADQMNWYLTGYDRDG